MVEIPANWERALATLQPVAPSACIVGGALRDLVLGGEVKDLDIFVDHREVDSYLEDHLTTLGWSRTNRLVVAEYQTGMRDEVVAVEEWHAPGLDIPIQIISLVPADNGLTFASKCLDRVDFDLCQIVYDGNCIRRAPGFTRAAAMRRFTLIRCEDEGQARRSIRRQKRFAERYPGFAFDMFLADQWVVGNQLLSAFS